MIAAKHIRTVSFGFGLMAALLLLLSSIFHLLRPGEIRLVARDKTLALKALPFSFAPTSNAYEKIGKPLLTLNYLPHKLDLPDLKSTLIYYGTNARPDAMMEAPLLHFGMPGSKKPVAVQTGQKLYLSFQRKGTTQGFSFSENNQPTHLWVIAESEENEALVKVQMIDPEGVMIDDDEKGSFKLATKEWIKHTPQNGRDTWELNKMRVDGTLLARQQARWFGPDVFLEKHGGDEFVHTVGKHRIDFGDGPSIYSIFVDEGDCLVWEEGHWKEVVPGEASLNKPLLHVKKADERIMTLDLWDESGHRKVPLTLIRANEMWAKEALERDFKFLGSRTKSQCVLEVGEEKILLRPDDWLILTQEGWKKLETEEEIDQYVDRKLSGTLFVFDGLVKKDEHQVLLGTLYNPSRTTCEQLEMAIQPNNITIIPGNTIPLNSSKTEHAYNK